mmetsp:Transcript_16467/g.56009  ORF Transcript_16467/g.56009 Transcript_16467/m.56009 type:complete len:128 (+) Transcript_16467:913-1296(+)
MGQARVAARAFALWRSPPRDEVPRAPRGALRPLGASDASMASERRPSLVLPLVASAFESCVPNSLRGLLAERRHERRGPELAHVHLAHWWLPAVDAGHAHPHEVLARVVYVPRGGEDERGVRGAHAL